MKNLLINFKSFYQPPNLKELLEIIEGENDIIFLRDLVIKTIYEIEKANPMLFSVNQKDQESIGNIIKNVLENTNNNTRQRRFFQSEEGNNLFPSDPPNTQNNPFSSDSSLASKEESIQSDTANTSKLYGNTNTSPSYEIILHELLRFYEDEDWKIIFKTFNKKLNF